MTHPLTERSVEIGNMSFALLESGPSKGPLALLFHGFPDTAWTWRHLLSDLAEAGYHAVAPYLRGYAPSSLSPEGQYSVAAIINDAVQLHDVLGGGPDAIVVGHDWGSAAAYGAGAFSPDRFARVIGLAVPPAGAFVQGLLGYEQLKRSFYMFFFQTPFAEGVVGADEMSFLARLWEDWSPGYDATEDMARVRQSLAAPENLTAALGYYRAMFDFAGAPAELAGQAAAALASVPQPTLYLHGRADGCLGWDIVDRPDIAATLEALLGEGSEVVGFEGLGHFLHLEAPALVNGRILEWLAE
jgi:pimeloyl-ACP methyl ester carboxylesterase